MRLHAYAWQARGVEGETLHKLICEAPEWLLADPALELQPALARFDAEGVRPKELRALLYLQPRLLPGMLDSSEGGAAQDLMRTELRRLLDSMRENARRNRQRAPSPPGIGPRGTTAR